MTIKLFMVGGFVRDRLISVPSKDVDFTVIAPSFDAMRHHIENVMGLKVFQSKPEFLTIRAGVPKTHELRKLCSDADFVMARKDGVSTDGRRPDSVEPGTIFDDLARRDFTINAIAQCPETGELIDPHGGRADLLARSLRFVGDPMTRIKEDGLRVLRGLRFSITKGLRMEENTRAALASGMAALMLESVSEQRKMDELNKMFAHDTMRAIWALQDFPHVAGAVFKEGSQLSLAATMKKRKGK